MKKLKYFVFTSILFISSITCVNANSLKSIDIDATIDKNGTLHIQEIWDMKTNKDTEIYKEEYNLGNMTISNFKVRDEKRVYTLKSNWNINASFENKKYQYGINRVSEGLELCWGISEYGNKTYTISYDLNNAIFNTEDAQVLYLRLINDLDFPPQKFNIEISGYKYFPDTLDVWGYGYKGYAYVNNGKIYMSNEENTKLKKGDYGVLLVKFPLNTFDTTNSYSQYETFNDVYKIAENGTFEYDYNENKINIFNKILNFISNFFPMIILITIILKVSKLSSNKYKFGTAGKSIDMNNINMFRDIPCQKNIFRAFFISEAYNLSKKNTDFIGSIFLKWLNEDKIKIVKTTEKKLFKEKEVTAIELSNLNQLETPIESELADVIIKASKDNILNQNELEKYSKNNYNKIFDWLKDAEIYGRDLYVTDNLVTKEKRSYVIDDKVKNDAIELAGLKKYLQEFSRIDIKQPLEVKLWKEYLMYAQIFGMADKVAKQFKNLYPEVLNEMQTYNYDIGDIILINNFSHTMGPSAESARSAAKSYSSGGGGFSSGGGGGGSFGGGGGGSR